LNLLHAIAIAGGSEFMSPLWMAERSDDEFSLSSRNDPRVVKKEVKYFNISNTTILYYIKKSGSFLVAYLIKEIQNFNYQSLKYDKPNFFDRMKQLESVQALKQLYGCNSTIAALNYDFIEMNLVFDEINTLNGNDKLNMLSFINERNVNRNKTKFNELKDYLIEELMMDRNSENVEDLLKKIGNIHKFNELLLKHIRKISSDEELEALLTWSLCAKNQKNVHHDHRKELEEWLKKIKIYRQILTLFKESKTNSDITWINILRMAENDTSVLINFLINEFTDLQLCNELLKFHPLQERNEEVFKIFIDALNKRGFDDQHDTLFKIIRNYSGKYLADFFDYSLDYIHNMKSMEQILDYLINSSSTNLVRYEKFQISCIIINHLDVYDEQLWSLAPYPLILIEQMLMNSKIESLNSIVKELRQFLENHPSCNLCNTTSKDCKIGETLVYDFNAYHNGYRISNNCLDFLFKIYAAKALDFQIIDIPTQTNPSLYSGTQGSDIVQVHQMPKDIPSKDMWVKDNEAVFCMCCKKSKFSLLNRRHHCRRFVHNLLQFNKTINKT
jgi:zinc finger FYVE domain-containing protein 26